MTIKVGHKIITREETRGLIQAIDWEKKTITIIPDGGSESHTVPFSRILSILEEGVID